MTLETLEDVERALLEVPATPTTDADLEKRRELMVQRLELIEAKAATDAALKARTRLSDTSPITIGCPFELTHFLTLDGQLRPVERDANGRRVVRLNNWNDFRALLASGDGLRWEQANSEAGGAIEQMRGLNLSRRFSDDRA
jgi:hypothetical protein